MTVLKVFKSPAADGQPYDLSTIMASAGTVVGGGPTAMERSTKQHTVTIVDEHPASLSGISPTNVAGWCDGIQKALTIRWCAGRPLTLAYVAAGAATSATPVELVGLVERLWMLCSKTDAEEARLLCDTSGVPLMVLDETDPSVMVSATSHAVGNARAGAERSLVAELVDTDHTSFWAVDGSLANMVENSRLFGVVKTHTARFLTDETHVHTLPGGWRSEVFTFTHSRSGEMEGEPVHVYSTYVRIQNLTNCAWDAGLVRVETSSRENLEPACAAVLAAAQSRAETDRDGRWDRQVGPVAWCEKLLRDRRPIVLR